MRAYFSKRRTMCESSSSISLSAIIRSCNRLSASKPFLTASGGAQPSKFGSMGVTAKFYSWNPRGPRSEISRSDQRGGPKAATDTRTINAYTAGRTGRASAIYLSGGGVANASYGLPDLGMTSLNDVLEDVDASLAQRICRFWSYRYGLGRRFQHRQDRAGHDRRRLSGSHIEIRCLRSDVAIAQIRPSYLCRKWWIASRPLWMRKPITILS